ncbi:MAG: hypothetical protein K2X86_05440 [Cytophagaceae bacterium]|nr:hypothetical protein [Cytophagaceae bacterium]
MFDLSFKDKREITLNNEELASLCKIFEEQFDIEKKKVKGNEIHYKLEGGINKMRWVDGGSLTLKILNDCLSIQYSIKTDRTLIIFILIIIVSFCYHLFTQGQVAIGLIPLVLIPIWLILSVVAHRVFKIRIDKSINQILSERVVISDQQKEWIDNPDKCPACGFENVLNKNTCPECGLTLK